MAIYATGDVEPEVLAQETLSRHGVEVGFADLQPADFELVQRLNETDCAVVDAEASVRLAKEALAAAENKRDLAVSARDGVLSEFGSRSQEMRERAQELSDTASQLGQLAAPRRRQRMSILRNLGHRG